MAMGRLKAEVIRGEQAEKHLRETCEGAAERSGRYPERVIGVYMIGESFSTTRFIGEEFGEVPETWKLVTRYQAGIEIK